MPFDETRVDGLGVRKRNFVSENENENENENESENENEKEASNSVCYKLEERNSSLARTRPSGLRKLWHGGGYNR